MNASPPTILSSAAPIERRLRALTDDEGARVDKLRLFIDPRQPVVVGGGVMMEKGDRLRPALAPTMTPSRQLECPQPRR